MSAGSGNIAWAHKPMDRDKAQANFQRNLLDLEARSRSAAAAINAVPGAEHVSHFYSQKGTAGTIAMTSDRMSAFVDIQDQREGQREAIKARGRMKKREGKTVLNMDTLPQMNMRSGEVRNKTLTGMAPKPSELQVLQRKEAEAREKLQRASNVDRDRAKRAFDKAKKKREEHEASLGRNRRGRGRTRAEDAAPGFFRRFYKHHVERRTSIIAVGLEPEPGEKKKIKNVPGSNRGQVGGTPSEIKAAEAEAEAMDAAKRAEARKVIKTLGLSQRELRYLKNQFEMIDVDGSGDIDYGEFFSFIKEEPSPYTDAFFDLIDYDNNGCIDFEEFIIALSTFAMYSEDDIFQFCFNTFDKDGSGDIDEYEYAGMIKALHNDLPLFPGNFHAALEAFDTNGDGLIDLREFKELARRHPMLFYPATRLQTKMQDATLGAKMWTTLRDRVAARKKLLKYRKKNKGALPMLTWKQRIWQFKHGVDPNAKLIAAELEDEAKLSGQALPTPVPVWQVMLRHLAWWSMCSFVFAIFALIVLIVLRFALEIKILF